MNDMRKVTVFLPADLLESCQGITGKGVSETIRTALRELIHQDARRRLLALQGKIDLEAGGLTLEMLRDESDPGSTHRAA